MKKLKKKLSSKEVIDIHKERNRFKYFKQRLRNVNIEETWDYLEKSLTLGDKRKSIDYINTSIDNSENNLRRAGMILQIAREELDQFKIHYRIAYGQWALEARQELGKLKNSKVISGQITQDMVEDWVAINKKEYQEWKIHFMELERNKNLTKQMFNAWESKTASLRKQAEIVEKRYGISQEYLEKRNRGD